MSVSCSLNEAAACDCHLNCESNQSIPSARASHRTTTNVSSQKLQILCSFIILRYYKKETLKKNGLSKKPTSSFTRWWSKGDGLSSCDWLGELAGDLKTCEMCWWSCSICSWTSCILLLLLLLQVSVWVLLKTWKHCANSTFCPLFLVISRLLSKFYLIFSSIRFFFPTLLEAPVEFWTVW